MGLGCPSTSVKFRLLGLSAYSASFRTCRLCLPSGKRWSEPTVVTAACPTTPGSSPPCGLMVSPSYSPSTGLTSLGSSGSPFSTRQLSQRQPQPHRRGLPHDQLQAQTARLSSSSRMPGPISRSLKLGERVETIEAVKEGRTSHHSRLRLLRDGRKASRSGAGAVEAEHNLYGRTFGAGHLQGVA